MTKAGLFIFVHVSCSSCKDFFGKPFLLGAILLEKSVCDCTMIWKSVPDISFGEKGGATTFASAKAKNLIDRIGIPGICIYEFEVVKRL